tara:strand:- start:398 stop:607 length:210 start_codon:yes stop_codon:yes gene_type:complete
MAKRRVRNATAIIADASRSVDRAAHRYENQDSYNTETLVRLKTIALELTRLSLDLEAESLGLYQESVPS